MEIGYNQATGLKCSSLERDLELCTLTGFDYIEVRIDMLKAYLYEHSLDQLEEYFQNHSLKAATINAIYLKQGLLKRKDTDTEKADFLDTFIFVCLVAQRIGAESIVVVPPLGASGYMIPYDDPTGDVFEDCVFSLKYLADISGRYGVNLAFEPVGAYKSAVRSITEAYDIIRAAGRENIGLALDAANIYVNDKLNDFSEILSLPVASILIVHINDYDDIETEAFSVEHRCFCGRGVIDLFGYLLRLSQIGYTGAVSVEVFRPEYWTMPPEELFKEAYGTTMRVLEPYYKKHETLPSML